MSSHALRQQIDALKQGVAQRDLEISALRLAIDKLTLELFHLRRMRYGRSSEKVDSAQSALESPGVALVPAGGAGDALQGGAPVADLEDARQKRQAATCRTAPRQLPGHLPRQEVIHLPSPECTCPGCGTALRQIGQDASEVLEYEPGSFKVMRHVRPRFACARCHTVLQAPAPSRPIERGLGGAGVITQVLVGKFCDHLPLYRQSQIYARQGVVVERSTLADWVAGAARLLQPLADAVRRYVLRAGKVHTDDTPVPVLSPGRGKTRTARLWVYARDDRPGGDTSPPAVWFQYSPDRKGEHPQRHLSGFTGTLQADAFAGYDALFDDGQVLEAACWATPGASSMKSTRARTRCPARWPTRRCCASGRCTPSKRTFAASPPMSAGASGKAAPDPWSKRCTAGSMTRWPSSRPSRPWHRPLATRSTIGRR